MAAWENYLHSHLNTAVSIDSDSIDKFTSSLIRAITEDKSIFTFGNGGSASTASHFSADLSLLKIRTGTNCRSNSLNTDLALSTAISNDLNYTSVISKQLEIFAKPGDIAVGFSASGNSINIIEGLIQATKMDLNAWAIIGFDGGRIKDLPGVNLIHFISQKDYGLIENLHMCLAHFVVDNLVMAFKTENQL